MAALNVLGFSITRSPRLRTAGTAFEQRSIEAQSNELRAKAGLPLNRPFSEAKAPSVKEFTAPVFNDWSHVVSTDADLETRSIQSDPRDAYILSLPWKLTPQQCLTIMRQALGGDLWAQAQLLYLMLDTWPVFRMAAHQLRENVAYAKYAVHPYAEEGDEPTDTAKAKAGLISRAIKSFAPNQFADETGFSGMAYHLADASLMGVSLVELLWQKRRGLNGVENLPRAACWVHPKHYTFTNHGSLTVFGQDRSVIFDGYQFNKRNPDGAPEPNQDKFICGQFLSRSGSVLGAGFMRPLVWYWAARQWGLEWMLTTAKQYGAPFISVNYRGQTLDASARQKLDDFMRLAGSNRRLILPEGSQPEIHPATNLGPDNPQRQLAIEADRMALYLLLGQEGTTMSTPGKLGDDDVKRDVMQERVQALANWLARNPLREFARSVIRQNYGEDSECPEIVADFTRPLSSGEVGNLISSVSVSGIPVRSDEFYRKINFTQPEPGDKVYQRGELVEMLTEEDRFAQALQKQQAQAEMELHLQKQAQPEPLKEEPKEKPKEKVESKAVLTSDTVKAKLSRMTPEQLDAFEDALTRAENAPKLNGEWSKVEELLNA